MPNYRRRLDFHHPHKKHKRYPQFELDKMALFAPSTTSTSTQYLSAPPAAPSRKRSQRFHRPRDDVDEFLSSDLELSFASTMSLHSPPHATNVLTPDTERIDLMDISPPANPVFTLAPSKKEDALKPKSRPRAFTSGARIFGRDMSNAASPAPQAPSIPKSGGSQSQNKRTQRSALPFEWLAQSPQVSEDKKSENLFAAVSVQRFHKAWPHYDVD